jgi:hypothetical protein
MEDPTKYIGALEETVARYRDALADCLAAGERPTAWAVFGARVLMSTGEPLEYTANVDIEDAYNTKSSERVAAALREVVRDLKAAWSLLMLPGIAHTEGNTETLSVVFLTECVGAVVDSYCATLLRDDSGKLYIDSFDVLSKADGLDVFMCLLGPKMILN